MVLGRALQGIGGLLAQSDAAQGSGPFWYPLLFIGTIVLILAVLAVLIVRWTRDR
jgi:hypothetical protein